MGNRSSASSNPLYRSYSGYGSLEDDGSSLNESIERLEYQPTWKRRLALGSILVCQLFNWVAFTTVTSWIPISLELNVYFFNGINGVEGYNSYIEK